MRIEPVTLRPFQSALKTSLYDAWRGGARDVIAVLPTGGGKTVVMSDVALDHQGASCHIAHRQELVGQISLALARNGVRHRLVASTQVMRTVAALHMFELGTNYLEPNARVAVAGVDTLVRKADDPHLKAWFQQVTLVQTDEGHHVLADNKWGTAIDLFPNARGVMWTATPGRADGKGLGRHADGLADAMVIGPSMAELIAQGYLTRYRPFMPLSDIDLTDVAIGSTGDYSAPQVRKAVHESHIVGDVVKHYLRIAPGKLGVTFAVDVAHAVEMAQAYRAAGVRAEVVSADTPDTARAAILRKFRNHQLDQLVNVDLFGEGFDLPAIECVSMARPTASYTLYAQQFGRVLRPMEGKEYGIILDHVGNIARHGLPDRPRHWSLDRREGRGKSRADEDAIPVRTCPECTAAYERIYRECPYCGYYPEPQERARPDQVDGDLVELEPTALAALYREIARVDGPARPPAHLAPHVQAVVTANHKARQDAQAILRPHIHRWCWTLNGTSDSEIHRRFYFKFGMTMPDASALGAADALALAGRINAAVK